MVLGFKGLDFEVQYRYTVCVVNFFLIIVSMYFILKLLFLKFRPLSGSVLVVGCDSGLFVWTVNPSSPILRYVLLFSSSFFHDSDLDIIPPYNINTISSRQAMRI